MKPIRALLAAALLLPALAAARDSRETLFAQIDALPMDRMCSTKGVYQYAFGGTDAPVSLLPSIDRMRLPPSAAPFKDVALGTTKWSSRFVGATYELETDSVATALAAIQRLARHFRARGWIAKEHVDDGADFGLVDLPPGEGEVNFYSAEAAMSGEGRTDVRVGLTRLGTTVTFTCEDMAMAVLNMEEALGNLPVGTPRPVRVEMPRPEALDPAIYDTPAGKARIEAIGGDPDALTRFILQRSRFAERLVTWKTDRLKKSGKVSSERMLRLTLGALQRGSPGGNPLAAFDDLMTMLEDAAEMGKLDEAGDAPGACRVAIRMLRKVERMEAVTAGQWAAVEAAIDAEAKRLGVSLD